MIQLKGDTLPNSECVKKNVKATGIVAFIFFLRGNNGEIKNL